MFVKRPWFNVLLIICLALGGAAFQPAVSPHIALAEESIPPDEKNPPPSPSDADPLQEGLDALEQALSQGPEAVVALGRTLRGEALDIAMPDIVRAQGQLARSAPPPPEGQAISLEEEAAALQADQARAEAERAQALSLEANPAGDLPGFPAGPLPASSNPNAPTADLTVGSPPCTYPTIGAAMSAASNGDRLLLEGGVTFYENLSVQKSLTFQGGYNGCGSASSDRTTIDGSAAGRVMYIHDDLNITLQNLVVTNGSSTGNGAGILARSNTQLRGTNLDITGNTSTALGGGLRLLGATAVFTQTEIESNTAAAGAGVHAEFYNGYAPSLDLRSYADVSNNTASGNGGGVYMSQGIISLTDSSDIYSNIAIDGGGAYLITSTLTLAGEYSEIMYNEASGNGGGIYAIASTINLDDQAELFYNTAGTDGTGSGGGAYLDDSDLMGDRAYIYYNQADDYGGGVYAANGSLLDMDLGGYPCSGPRCSQLSYNTATTLYGGGAYARDTSEIDLRQIFVENNQASYGGGLYAYQSLLYLYNTLLARNNATINIGDALRLYTGTTLHGAHNTFAHNDAGGAATGRAIDLDSATVNLQNSVIWGHAASLSDAAQNITCSDIQGSYPGTSNIDLDPLFIDPASQNFHLQHTSPTIDQCATGQAEDFDNELRPIIYARPSTPYDMGADEASARVGLNGSACAYGRIQDAIDAAVDGDTIQASSDTFVEMLGISGKQLTIAGGYDTDCSTYITGTTVIDAGGSGSVIYTQSSTLTLRSLNLTGGNAGVGGGLALLSTPSSPSFVTLDHTDVYGNQAIFGGGIYIDPSQTLTITNDSEVFNNTATSNGGGARVWGRLVANDGGSRFDYNAAPYGGGISVPLGGELVLAGSHVMANQATAADGKGGGIHVYDGGRLTISGGSNVSGNTAYDGAGIYADNANLTYFDTLIYDNDAVHYGGGLYLGNGSSLSANNASVGAALPGYGNTAEIGAGIYVDSSSMDFSGHIYNNAASDSGGGIFASSSVITLTQTHLGGTGADQPNQIGAAGLNGAGMYLDNTQASISESTIAGNFLQNTLTGYGGGAYIYTSTITMTNSIVADNLASASLTDGRGGGLYVYDSSLTLDHTQVHDNAAGTNGGGIRLFDRGTINILNGSELFANQVTNGDGGALATAGSGNMQINISNAAIYENTASGSGGAIALMGTGILKFTGAWDLHHNTAGVDGGALAIYNTADARFSNGPGYFSNNQAGGSGGAVYLNNNTTLELYATSGSPITLQANSAGANGGALAADAAGYFDIYGQVTLTGNSAGAGGAIYLSNGSRTWLDDYYTDAPNVNGNSAGSGGAIYAENSPSVRCDGAALNSNTAANGSGGAIYLTASTASAENCTFHGNSATLNGGAIAAYAGSSLEVRANLGSTALAGEEAALPGVHNSIQATGCNPADQQCSSFAGNLADSDGDSNGSGGAIYNNDGALSVSQTYFHRNQAYAGGAIYQNGPTASAVVTDTLIYSNTVTAAFGAGIRQSDGAFTVNHVTIAHNTGGSGFSALAIDSYAAYNSIAWGNAGHSGFSQPTTFAECNIDEGGNAGLNVDPQFASPGSGENYHLSDTSPAIDACPTGLASDLDGRTRPVGAGYDRGAYEFDDQLLIAKSVSQPSFEPGQSITFTLTLTNQGSFAATHLILTDTLTLLTSVTVHSTLTLTDTGHTPSYAWLVQDLPALQSATVTIAGSLISPLAAGTYTNIAFIAADGDQVGPNNSASASFTVLNVAPTITTFPPGMANLDQLYTYEIHTLDRNGDLVSFTAPVLPAWLNLEDHGDGTATLSGTPRLANLGDTSVTITAADPGGLSESNSFTIELNQAPGFTSTPLTAASVGSLYTYHVTTQDATALFLSITPNTLPAWLNLVDNGDGTATLIGTPTLAHLGDHAVSLRVTDDGGLYANQTFTITVSGGGQFYLPITFK